MFMFLLSCSFDGTSCPDSWFRTHANTPWNNTRSRRRLPHDVCARRKLRTVLRERFLVPGEVASEATRIFLRDFRLCPDNPGVSLDQWRVLLWEGALAPNYAHLARDVYRVWLRLRYECLRLTPAVSSLLRQLRGSYRLGLITNGPSRAQWEKVETLGLRDYFDCILVSGDLPWEKPHRDIFLEACRALAVEPRRCLMVGDKLETDIEGGLRACLGGTVWVAGQSRYSTISSSRRNSSSSSSPRPDYTLADVTDLIRLLRPPDLEDSNSNASDGS